MRIRDMISKVADEHRMMTNDPLVIEFSGSVALNVFLRGLEADLGMSAGELRHTQLREGWPHQMCDGIEFRVKPRDPAKEAFRQFWEGYESLADAA